jgi:hypothetical protein
MPFRNQINVSSIFGAVTQSYNAYVCMNYMSPEFLCREPATKFRRSRIFVSDDQNLSKMPTDEELGKHTATIDQYQTTSGRKRYREGGYFHWMGQSQA